MESGTLQDPRNAIDRSMAYIREVYTKAETDEQALGRLACGWLLATFLALNSGGLITVLGSAGRIENAAVVGLLFLAGMVAALATGISGLIAIGLVAKQSTAVVTHLRDYSVENYYGDYADKLKELLDPSPDKWLVIPILCAIMSGILAIAGVIVAYASFEPSGRANDRRCLAIQRDMLSAEPRRDDGPDLFQALGCRPQGEGSVYASPVARKASS